MAQRYKFCNEIQITNQFMKLLSFFKTSLCTLCIALLFNACTTTGSKLSPREDARKSYFKGDYESAETKYLLATTDPKFDALDYFRLHDAQFRNDPDNYDERYLLKAAELLKIKLYEQLNKNKPIPLLYEYYSLAEKRLERLDLYHQARQTTMAFHKEGKFKKLKDPNNLVSLGNIAFTNGEKNLYKTFYESALNQASSPKKGSFSFLGGKSEPLNKAAIAEAAYSLYLFGDAKDAKNYLDQTLKYNPKHGGALTALGTHFENEHRYAHALTFYQEAAKVDPQSTYTQNGIAACAIELQKNAIARRAINKAVSIDDQNPKTAYLSSLLNYTEGNHSEAIEEVNRSIKLGPRSANPYLLASTINLKKGDASAAIKALELAKTGFPDEQRIYWQLSQAYEMQNRLKPAIASLKKYDLLTSEDKERKLVSAKIKKLNSQLHSQQHSPFEKEKFTYEIQLP